MNFPPKLPSSSLRSIPSSTSPPSSNSRSPCDSDGDGDDWSGRSFTQTAKGKEEKRRKQRRESHVEHALKTRRQLNTNVLLSDVCLAKLTVDSYVQCVRSVHAAELEIKLGMSPIDGQHLIAGATTVPLTTPTQTPPTPVTPLPQVMNFIELGRIFRGEKSQQLLEEEIKPKLADIFLFYVSARDYSEAQISVLVEGLTDLMTAPQLSAVKHDAHFKRVFEDIMKNYQIKKTEPPPTSHNTDTSEPQPASFSSATNDTLSSNTLRYDTSRMNVAKAIEGGLLPEPCVTIQRCHALFPTQLSSSLARRSPLSAAATPAATACPSLLHYGDSHAFGSSALYRPFFSPIMPLLCSLARYDMLMFELSTGFNNVIRVMSVGRGNNNDLCNFRRLALDRNYDDGNGIAGDVRNTQDHFSIHRTKSHSTLTHEILKSRWKNINAAGRELEHIWRRIAIFVDCVDPEIRTIANLKQKHCKLTSTVDENVTSSSIYVRTAGVHAVKRTRGGGEANGGSGSRPKKSVTAFKDPLRNIAMATNKEGFRGREENASDSNTVTGRETEKTWKETILLDAENLCDSDSDSASPFCGLHHLPRDVMRHLCLFLTPREISSVILVSKSVLRAVVPSVIPSPIVSSSSPLPQGEERHFLSFENSSVEDLYILRSLQMSNFMGKLLEQFVQQLWGERYVFLQDKNMLSAAGLKQFSACLSYLKHARESTQALAVN